MSTDPRIAIVQRWINHLGEPDCSDDETEASDLLAKLDSATPEPSGEEVEKALRRLTPNRCGESPCFGCETNEAAVATIRAALGAMRPTGEALGLARELLGLVRATGGSDTDAPRLAEAEEKARALVATLGGEK